MNIEEAKECAKLCIIAKIPSFWHGPPGIGKTRGWNQVADELKRDFLGISAPLLQPVDLLGLPDRQGNKTIWSRPEILPEEGEGIILIDELPDSSQLMQKAFYSLVLEHRVQSHIIPDSWYIAAAGNRVEDKAMASSLPSPLITRFCHLGICCPNPDFTKQTVEKAEIDLTEFIPYALKHFHPVIAAYLKFKPEHCYHHQAVPRTWEFVSNLLSVTKEHFINPVKQIIKGLIGEIVGNDFYNFLKLATKIPSIDSIINNPETADIPDEKDIRFNLVTALIHHITEDNATNILKYGLRLHKEIQTFMFDMAKNIKPFITTNPIFINWLNENKEYRI